MIKTIYKPKNAKVLLLDIETAPMLGNVWGLFDQNIGLNQIHKDWHILSWAAKWLGEKEVMYMDQRKASNIEDDRKILKGIWELIDQADVIITQNGKSFDQKKLNARFIIHGFKPPSHVQHIDTRVIAKKHFAFTSNKLEYLTNKLCTKYRKLKPKFSGFDLWKECISGNLKAWKEMERYNKHDVLSLEELYTKLVPWDNTINFNTFHGDTKNVCSACGHNKFEKRGYLYTKTGKYQKYSCRRCGSHSRDKINLLTKEKRNSLKTRL